MAVVKNLAKDGRYYWVVTDFEPKFNPLTNEIVSYTAYRRAAPEKAVKAIAPIYAKLRELGKGVSSPLNVSIHNIYKRNGIFFAFLQPTVSQYASSYD